MMFFGKQRKPRDPWAPDTELLRWTAGAPWSVADSYMGALILGSTGSGKSSGSLSLMSRSMLEAGYGGIFFTVKPEDRGTYLRYAADAGRSDDVVVFSPDHRVFFNFIADEVARSPTPLGLVENLAALILTVTELGKRESAGGDHDRFFRLEANRLCLTVLLVLVLALGTPTITEVHRFIVSLPRSLDEARGEAWKGSFCFQCLRLADEAKKTDSQRADFDLALTYVLEEWAGMSWRTRSGVQSTLTSATDQLARGAARDMLSSPSPNLSFDQLYAGKVIIADFPVLVLRDVGRLIQVVFKFMAQRALACRDVTKFPRPVFLVADEAQSLLVDADQHFQAIARSTRTAVVYATQSVSGLIDAFGPQSEAKVHTLLTNLQTRICHQQTDVRTVQYMQELIGRSRQVLMGGSTQRDADWLAPLLGADTGACSFNEAWEHELQAADLNALAKGGLPHRITEAVVYQGGRPFPDGRTWARVCIPQR